MPAGYLPKEMLEHGRGQGVGLIKLAYHRQASWERPYPALPLGELAARSAD